VPLELSAGSRCVPWAVADGMFWCELPRHGRGHWFKSSIAHGQKPLRLQGFLSETPVVPRVSHGRGLTPM
jgi:hypothetical protein